MMSASQFSDLIFGVTFLCYFIDKVISGPIVNGKLAGKGEFGYHVSVEKFNTSFCGGGIIDDLYIVSAAHCFVNNENELEDHPIKVIVGTEDLYTECERKVSADVEEIFIPAEFDTRKSKMKKRTVADIAVLKLKTKLGIEEHKYIKKLNLPTKDKDYDGKMVMVTGFGYNYYNKSKKFTAEGCKSRDNKLRYAEAMVVNSDKCEKLKKQPITEKHLCAAAIQYDPDKPVGVCDGDSGGPLVYKKDRLIGILSTSPNHCREDKAPAVYTKVWPFIDFIMNVRHGRIDTTIRNITLLSTNEWLSVNMVHE